jgi:hypothetical protein
LREAKAAFVSPTYAYARDNPVRYTDPTGNAVLVDSSCDKFPEIKRIVDSLKAQVLTSKNASGVRLLLYKAFNDPTFVHTMRCDTTTP